MALCWLIAMVSLMSGYCMLSLVVSLVFSLVAPLGKAVDPAVDEKQTIEQTNRSSSLTPVTGQLENWYRRPTVHFLPTTADARRPCHLLLTPSYPFHLT